jgi:predicted acylesterase/phospholipase RssA
MKTALVLSAGGMYAAWQAGAWRALARRLDPEIVIGASAGALNAWAIASNADPDALAREWLAPELAHVAKWRWQAPWRGVFDAGPLVALIQSLTARYTPRRELGIVAVDLPRLRPRLFRYPGIGWRHLAASCAVLLGYEQVRIGGAWFTDGGLLGALPLWAAAEMGAGRALGVNALPVMPSRLVRWAVRGIRVFGRAPQTPAGLDARILSPSLPLGPLRDAVFWRRDAVERWIALGESDALAMAPW